MEYTLLDSKTKELISKWDSTKWIEILDTLIAGDTIPYNISFSEELGPDRIIEVYKILIENKLRDNEIIAAAYLIFQRDLWKRDKSVLYHLVRFFDEVSPITYFERLAYLLQSNEYDEIFDYVNEGDYQLRYRLLSVLLPLDTEKKLLHFLIDKSHHLQPPEYYQITIRYIYRNCETKWLGYFMRYTLALDLANQHIDHLLFGFKEDIFMRKNFDLLFNWLSLEFLEDCNSKTTLRKTTVKFFRTVSRWINDDKERVQEFLYYPETFAILSPYNVDNNFDFPAKILEGLLENRSSHINQFKILEYITRNNKNIRKLKFFKDKLDRLTSIKLGVGNTYLDIDLNINLVYKKANFLMMEVKKTEATEDFELPEESLLKIAEL